MRPYPKDLHDTIHEALSKGKVTHAQVLLRKARSLRLTRSEKLAFASLAWRLGMPSAGIRWLHPYVRPSGRKASQPTPEERLEYATCLLRMDALEEAFQCLEGIDASKHPRCHFIKAALCVATWDYASAIPYFRDYLRADILPYPKLVAGVNLAAALVHERREGEATTLLDGLLATTAREGYDLLHGNCLELSAQNHIFSGRWEAAREALDQAALRLQDPRSLYTLFIRKWQAVLALVTNTREVAPLKEVRNLAAELSHWETVRDCDALRATYGRDRTLFWRAYFGTRFSPYRARLLEDFSGIGEVPDRYLWLPGKKKGPTLDLLDPETHGLPFGSLPHRVLLTLASDFYSPFRIPALHAALYPGRLFHPSYSPACVHEGLRRTRDWLRSKNLPLQIVTEAISYRLRAEAPVGILVPQKLGIFLESGSPLFRLKKRLGTTSFSIVEAAAVLECSPRTALRVLLDGGSDVKRTGKAKATRYRFVG